MSVELHSPKRYFSSYSESMVDILDLLCSQPDAVKLMEKVKGKQGKITLEVGNDDDSTVWNWNKKEILLNPSLLNSKNDLVGYILFELNNACLTEKFIEILENVQEVEQFVESFEKLEHTSAIKARKIAIKILGEDAEFDFKWIYRRFDLHYAVQQINGHSERIAKYYFPKKIYLGTLKHSIQALTQRAKNYLYALLYYDIRSNEKEVKRLFSALNGESFLSQDSKKALDCANVLFSKNLSAMYTEHD